MLMYFLMVVGLAGALRTGDGVRKEANLLEESIARALFRPSNLTIVVARNEKESIDEWVHEVKGIPMMLQTEFALEVQHPMHTPREFVKPRDIVGNTTYECGGYLNFIVDQYEHLPLVSIFVHGDPRGGREHRHGDFHVFSAMRQIAANPHNVDYCSMNGEDTWFDYPRQFENGTWLLDDLKSDPSRFPSLARFAEGIKPSRSDRRIAFYDSGQFAVSRKRIRAHPLEFYKELLDWMREAPDPRDLLWRQETRFFDDDLFGRSRTSSEYRCGILEMSWHQIFGEPSVLDRFHSRCAFRYGLDSDASEATINADDENLEDNLVKMASKRNLVSSTHDVISRKTMSGTGTEQFEIKLPSTATSLDSQTMARATSLLQTNGFLVLRGGALFSTEQLEKAFDHVTASLDRVKTATKSEDISACPPWAYNASDRARCAIAPFDFMGATSYTGGRLDQEFPSSHELFGHRPWRNNSIYSRMCHNYFDEQCKHHYMAVLWNFPGANAEYWHRDTATHGLKSLVMATAISDHPSEVGWPAYQPYTHRPPFFDNTVPSSMPPRPEHGEPPRVQVTLRKGDSVIWPFQTKHTATANLAQQERPLLYSVYGVPDAKVFDAEDTGVTNADGGEEELTKSAGGWQAGWFPGNTSASDDFASSLFEAHRKACAP